MKTLTIFLKVIILSLVLNLIWEFSHYSLYIDLSGISPVPHLILASFTDMLIIFGILIVISIKNKNFRWIRKAGKFDYVFIIVLGLIVAIFIELWALGIDRWAYKEFMPTIFGIGLSPLIQLGLTGVISLFVVSYFLRQHNK